jgi:hypothetical protein
MYGSGGAADAPRWGLTFRERLAEASVAPDSVSPSKRARQAGHQGKVGVATLCGAPGACAVLFMGGVIDLRDAPDAARRKRFASIFPLSMHCTRSSYLIAAHTVLVAAGAKNEHMGTLGGACAAVSEAVVRASTAFS